MIARRIVVAAALLGATLPGALRAQERFITLASTTSTEQSGLFRHLIPIFRQDTGIDVRVVAVGTGQALAIGARGDTPTRSSCTTAPARISSSPTATASTAATSCTMTS